MLLLALIAELVSYKPTAVEVVANYARGPELRREWSSKAYNLRLTANWVDENRFWYRTDVRQKTSYHLVDAAAQTKKPAFDEQKVSEALAKKFQKPFPRLDLQNLAFSSNLGEIRFDLDASRWTMNLSTYEVGPFEEPPAPRTPPRRGNRPQRNLATSPDGKFSLRMQEGNLSLTTMGSSTPTTLSTAGSFTQWAWSPDSKHFSAIRLVPGERKQVHLVESSPRDGGRAVLRSRGYDLPGDRLDTHEVWLFDAEAKTGKKVDADPIEIDFEISTHWKSDGASFNYVKTDRGNTRFRLYDIDAKTGAVSTLIDHQPKTFIDQTTRWLHYLANDDILWRSEKDGWNRLYYVDRKARTTRPITTGNWVVRAVDFVDEAKKQIWFQASGFHFGEDPYNIHAFRVNFDGSDLKEITPQNGNHTLQYSPTRKFVVASYSTPERPPVHEVRNADGQRVMDLGQADIEDLKKTTWKAPESCTAYGGDGKTPNYGVGFSPTKLD